MNKLKLFRNTTVATTVESMSMISMQERATCSTWKAKMKKSDSSWKSFQEKLLSKKQNCRNKQLGQNSMS